ncbi:(2Fe-2S)-binding protein [Enhydrobacter aerosaccus]|uniref:(2Fe-2S)-binding protein n=1 Tax=Enhydrobacter aerosaccus TaxID=225324 RepID=UPI000A2F5553|nr:(2Fe-2S)-binding protein [Enhydrobacter aerosaccus]
MRSIRNIKFMYICICRAIRDRDIETAVRAGARRPVDVFRACGHQPQCGGCAADMRQKIEQVLTEEAATAAPLLAAD